MSQENVQLARRGYAALNDAYRADDINAFLPFLQEFWHPEVVFEPAGVLPEGPAAVQGWDGVLQFLGGQMQAFEKRTMWMEPLEYLDAGDCLVVPYRFGGRARHTGIEMEFSFVHVFTMRAGKVVHAKALATKGQALDAVGLSE